jgi:thiol-disulfide isomerase/thioredoxin
MIDKKNVPVLVAAAVAAAALAYLLKDSLRAPEAVRALPKAPPAAAAPTALGKAPPVSLPGGGQRDLTRPPGKLLIVHYWATWCLPCVTEFPDLLAFWKEYGKNPALDLVAVSVDEDWKTVDDWVRKVGAGGVPLALDPRRAAAKAFGTEKFPETYILSPTGQVVDKFIGPLAWSSPAFRRRIDELLKAPAAAPSGG